MKKGFQILSLVFLLAWVFGYVIFHMGLPVHVCLATALLCYIQSVITTTTTDTETKPGYNSIG